MDNQGMVIKKFEQQKESERKNNTGDLLQKMQHLSICNNPRCTTPGCSKLKRVLRHTTECKRKIESSCAICKQFLHVCIIHEKSCHNKACKIYFCTLVKRRMAQRRGFTQRNANTQQKSNTQQNLNTQQLAAVQKEYEQRQARGTQPCSISGSVLPRKANTCKDSSDFHRSLSLQIPTSNTGSWLHFHRSESLEPLRGSPPELVGPRISILPTETYRDMSLLIAQEEITKKEEVMDTI